MQYFGELISLGVAFSWTITALASEVGSRRLGVLVLNVWRLGLAMLCSALLMWVIIGVPFPLYASGETWMWLMLSGVVGYFFGDWCLFNSYLCFGSRYGQLFMTLAPMFAALSAWVALGQTLSWGALIAMIVTLTGIAVSVLGRGEHHTLSLQLPTKGILFGIGAALGQGVGLILSKIGLDHYTAEVPSTLLPEIVDYLPFGANMIRCLAGTACFLFWLLVSGERSRLEKSVHERKGMIAMKEKDMLKNMYDRHFWSVSWCWFLADGCTIYRCWHCFYHHGTESYSYYCSLLLSLPSKDYSQRSYRRHYLHCRRIAVLFALACSKSTKRKLLKHDVFII